MSETKAATDRAAVTKTEVERLRAENERLRGQLAARGTAAGQVAMPQHLFLSEGDRQELEIRGVVNIGGRLMTKDEVLAELADTDQSGVEIADAPEGTRVDPSTVRKIQERPAILGVDYVYPSVAPGKIDPAVAGTPGINGPTAE